MNPGWNERHFRPEEGTLLDIASLEAIPAMGQALIYQQLISGGITRHGLVLSGLRVGVSSGRFSITPGLAAVPDEDGRLVLAPQKEPVVVTALPASPVLLVARAHGVRLIHQGTGLKGAGVALELEFALVAWSELSIGFELPLAAFDPESGRLENDVCRLLQPDEVENVELTHRLRALQAAHLSQEGARAQLEYQGQVQESLQARDHLYLAGIQGVIQTLRVRPTSSLERVRLIGELAVLVMSLYRTHPRLRDYLREILSLGYVDHVYSRQLRTENAAVRFHQRITEMSGGVAGPLDEGVPG